MVAHPDTDLVRAGRPGANTRSRRHDTPGALERVEVVCPLSEHSIMGNASARQLANEFLLHCRLTPCSFCFVGVFTHISRDIDNSPEKRLIVDRLDGRSPVRPAP